MTKLLTSRIGLATSTVLGVLLTCCISGPAPTATSNELPAASESTTAGAGISEPDLWYQAIAEANQAAGLATTATTAAQWHQVAAGWGRSIALLHGIGLDDPRQPIAQRKAQEYRQNLDRAQRQADQQGLPRALPTLGSDVLDEQVSLYRAYVAALGPPDVLIVGSSRSLQGIDPQVLQQALALEGSPGLRV
ncbi:MAG: hypothetical protein AAFW95_11850, partial [Cyanobacteria bacterium J06638_6]